MRQSTDILCDAKHLLHAQWPASGGFWGNLARETWRAVWIAWYCKKFGSNLNHILVLVMVFNAMDPRLLIPIIAWVAQIPQPHPNEALDFVPRLYHLYKMYKFVLFFLSYFDDCDQFEYVNYILLTNHGSQVEVCAGDGRLTQAMLNSGYCGTGYDVSLLSNLT